MEIGTVDTLENCQQLTCFQECCGRTCQKIFTGLGDAVVILLIGSILFCRSKLSCIGSVAADIFQNTQHDGFFTVIKTGVSRIVESAVIANLVQQSRIAFAQSNSHVGTHMVHAANAGLINMIFFMDSTQFFGEIVFVDTAVAPFFEIACPCAGQCTVFMDVNGKLGKKTADVFTHIFCSFQAVFAGKIFGGKVKIFKTNEAVVIGIIVSTVQFQFPFVDPDLFVMQGLNLCQVKIRNCRFCADSLHHKCLLSDQRL